MPGSDATLVPEASSLGSANSILTARGRRHAISDFPGPLSIKTVIGGRVAWKIERRDVWVDESSFLVLNDGEPYSMRIDEPKPVTTCCVFFERGFVESVARGLTCPEGRLLDEPAADPVPLAFLSRLHSRDQRVVPATLVIRAKILEGASGPEMEERYLLLARDLLLVYEETRRQLARIPAARASTREEVFRRLSRGREFLHAYCGGQVTLQQAARAACLSKYHFHRSFAQAFGETPHSYLTRLRLERARALLTQGRPVTEACGAAGFESLGSFSALFHKRFGIAPSRFARRN